MPIGSLSRNGKARWIWRSRWRPRTGGSSPPTGAGRITPKSRPVKASTGPCRSIPPTPGSTGPSPKRSSRSATRCSATARCSWAPASGEGPRRSLSWHNSCATAMEKAERHRPLEPEILVDAEAERLRAAADLLARLLDSAFRIPGTRFTVGLDPLIGLVPGLGDALAGLVGTLLLVLAVRLRVPRIVLLRM